MYFCAFDNFIIIKKKKKKKNYLKVFNLPPELMWPFDTEHAEHKDLWEHEHAFCDQTDSD